MRWQAMASKTANVSNSSQLCTNTGTYLGRLKFRYAKNRVGQKHSLKSILSATLLYLKKIICLFKKQYQNVSQSEFLLKKKKEVIEVVCQFYLDSLISILSAT